MEYEDNGNIVYFGVGALSGAVTGVIGGTVAHLASKGFVVRTMIG